MLKSQIAFEIKTFQLIAYYGQSLKSKSIKIKAKFAVDFYGKEGHLFSLLMVGSSWYKKSCYSVHVHSKMINMLLRYFFNDVSYVMFFDLHTLARIRVSCSMQPYFFIPNKGQAKFVPKGS